MEIQDGRYFCKIVYVIADPQIYRTFESIKNCQRCDFLKIFVIPRGNATPHKFQRGDTSAPLPDRSGRYQGTTPTTWLNFNTPCKSQLKKCMAILPYYNQIARLPCSGRVEIHSVLGREIRRLYLKFVTAQLMRVSCVMY